MFLLDVLNKLLVLVGYGLIQKLCLLRESMQLLRLLLIQHYLLVKLAQKARGSLTVPKQLVSSCSSIYYCH